ncbi:MAG: hypothetical protein WB507_04910 [Solirubrobacterales bacterium]
MRLGLLFDELDGFVEHSRHPKHPRGPHPARRRHDPNSLNGR